MKDQRLIYADPCDLDTLRQALKMQIRTTDFVRF